MKVKYQIQPQILASKLPKKSSKSAYGLSFNDDIFVALPASNLTGKWVQLRIQKPNGPKAIVPIGHIGPWNGGGWNNKFDDPYWRKTQRPQAESGRDLRRRKTDGTGIQLSHRLWSLLGLGRRRKITLSWHFVPSIRRKTKIVINLQGKRIKIPHTFHLIKV